MVFAESADGRDLSKTASTNVLRTRVQGDDNAWIDHPVVLRRNDGKFLLVYDGSTNIQPPFLPRRIYARISEDGVIFGPRIELPASDLDRNPQGLFFQSVPDLIQLLDGSIRVYYTAPGDSIASMRSTDGGLTWTQDGGYRLSGHSPWPAVFPPDRKSYVEPAVVQERTGTVLMYFGYFQYSSQCRGIEACQRIRLARSADGLSFSVHPEDLLPVSPGATAQVDPDVYQTADGRWYMLYGEVMAGGNPILRVAFRTQ